MRKFLKECWERIQAPTPAFWKKVRNFCMVAAGFGAAAYAVPGEMLPSHPWVESVIQYSVLLGCLGAGLSQLTKETPNNV